MKKQKIGGGEHACIRDDSELIFTPTSNVFDLMMPLVDLTYKTRNTHAVHDFTKAVVGHGVMRDRALAGETNGLQEIQVFSPDKPVKNGDLIITTTGVRMAFDVESGVRTKGLYVMNAVKHLPDLHIGHALPAPATSSP